MKIKPEERPQIIGLGVAIGAVLLFGVTRLLPQITGGNNTAAAQPGTADASTGVSATPGTSTVAPLNAGMGTPGQNVASNSKGNMFDDAVVEPATTHDPFTPTVPTDVNPFNRPVTGQVIRPTSPPRVRVFPPTITTIQPTFVPHPIAPQSNSMMPGTDANLQANQVILAGVIAGPQAVAVIHIGDRAYPLSAGEKMPYNMSVARITEDGVYVKQGKQTWFIQVGKSLSAAMPIKPGQQGFNAPGSMAPNATFGPVRRITATGAANSVTFEEPSP